MTDIFTASNGITVEVVPDEYLVAKGYANATYADAGPLGIDALREYFQAERDRELGRWRDPKAPIFVVYNSDIEYVRVVNEATGMTAQAWRDDPRPLSTAKRYFDAHPKPAWHDAQPGEVWLITLDGSEEPALYTNLLLFETTNTMYTADSDEITAGRRIWPEDDDE